MSGPFALTLNGALRKILHTWGARLTWTAQRHHAGQLLKGMTSFFANHLSVDASELRFNQGVSHGSVQLPYWHRNLVFGHVDQGMGDFGHLDQGMGGFRHFDQSISVFGHFDQGIGD